jgi:hypothetical protein
MAIHEVQVTQIEGGFTKKIDKDSERMIFDNLQKTQYSHPEKSTVRELASNGIDAIRERDIAKSILTGKSKIEDHFVQREGSEYSNSQFDPVYYDLKWLSDEPRVFIRYIEGSALEKDKVIISDYGVGLYGRRLSGYFNLGFSTKRLSRFGLGKYGIGAKAALSTGVPFYTVRNYYNGTESHFNVYNNQVVPIIPKFNLETGQENPCFELEGITCHYKNTTRLNGLEVELEVKKHHKQKYIDAVKSQLLYFDNVVFQVEAHNGTMETIQVRASILYEDDIMILSDNQMYSKPHILINRVNYGNVDFLELELEDKTGNISIKFKPEEVDVNPSREHVMWGDLTRESIKKRFQEVQKSAEIMLQKELQETDFMKWLRACIAVKNKLGTEQTNTLVGRLSKLVDLSNYSPKYKPDPQFILNGMLFAGVAVRKVTGKIERRGSMRIMRVDRSVAGLTDLVSGDIPVFVQLGNTNVLRDRYLLEDVHQAGFVTIWLNETEVEQPVIPEGVTDEQRQEIEKSYIRKKDMLHRQALEAAFELKLVLRGDFIPRKIEESFVEMILERWRKLNYYILTSEGIRMYDDIEVPEVFKERNNGKEEDGTISREEEVQSEEAKVSAEARRKLEGKTILFTPRISSDKDQLYDWHKLEIPVGNIDNWNNSEVYYSSDDDSSLLQLAAFITRPAENIASRVRYKNEELVASPEGKEMYDYDANDRTVTISKLTAFEGPIEVKLIKVARDRVKYYRDFKHIRNFFAEVTKNKVITMSSKLIKWNTARYIYQHIEKLAFLSNFSQFHAENHQTYHQLYKYMVDHYRSVGDYKNKFKELEGEEYDDMIKHMDKVSELQIFVSENKGDAEAITKVVQELFGTGTENLISDGCALDMNIRNMLHQLLEYAEPLSTMLNEMQVLTAHPTGNIDEDLETEIRNFIAFKQAGH